MSKTYLSLKGLPVRYVRLLTLGRYEIALTWIDREKRSNKQ